MTDDNDFDILEKADILNKEAKEDQQPKLESGRIRYIRLSGTFFIKLLTNKIIGDFIVNPLPPDTKYLRGGTDALGTLFMVIESESFDMVYEGEEIPFHGDIVFKRNPVIRRIQ